MQMLNNFVRKRSKTHFEGILSMPQDELVVMLSMQALTLFSDIYCKVKLCKQVLL